MGRTVKDADVKDGIALPSSSPIDVDVDGDDDKKMVMVAATTPAPPPNSKGGPLKIKNKLSNGGTGAKYGKTLSKTSSYSILIFLLFWVLEGGECEVGLTTDEYLWQKLVLM